MMVDVDRFPFLTLALSRMHFNRLTLPVVVYAIPLQL